MKTMNCCMYMCMTELYNFSLMGSTLQIVVIVFTQLVGLWAKEGMSRTDIVKDLLLHYNNQIPPNFDSDESLHVKVGIYINSFDSINESSMGYANTIGWNFMENISEEILRVVWFTVWIQKYIPGWMEDYALSIYLRQLWRDPRLQYEEFQKRKYITLDAHMVERVWKPDLFFSNEKMGEFHYITVPNNFIRLYPNGTIIYSTRLSLVLSCPMKLHKFPMDEQVCKMAMETYAYSTDQLRFEWAKGENALEINPNLQLSQFKFQGHKLRSTTTNYNTGEFAALEVLFFLKRDLGYYMIQTYAPCVMVVILSWVSFWLSYDAVPARISLGVLTVLTMTTMSSGTLSTLPRVSYIKAMDVWMSTCLLFVFAALLEFAFVNVLTRKDTRRCYRQRHSSTPCQGENHSKLQPEPLTIASNGSQSYQYTDESQAALCSKGHVDCQSSIRRRHAPSYLDNVSKYAFPTTFFLFNLVYWLGYNYWDEQDLHWDS